MISMRPYLNIVALGCLVLCSTAADKCTLWGGPKQDFKVKARGLAGEWPKDGPRKLWSRDIGEGYSGILHEGGRLYTMDREGDQEVAMALNAKTGKMIWEHKYDSPPHAKHVKEFNSGPRGTPLLVGNRLYTIGCTGKLHCLNAKTGKVRWSHDLWEEFEDATFLNHGYSSSAFPYGDTVIVLVGGKGHGMVAYNQKNGEFVWKNQDFENSYSTPKRINVDGQDQLLCFMATELAAIDPNNGDLFWSIPQENRWRQNISMPIWGKDHILFLSSNGDGSRGLKLTRKGNKTEVEELWQNKKLGIHHTNAIRVGDYVYASTGGRGPGLFQAINVKTGELAWRERGFAKANFLLADGRFLLLDEDGNLGLATATPEFFQVHAKVPELGARAWTVPTLVGKTLYIRDSKTIMALDLGAKPKKS